MRTMFVYAAGLPSVACDSMIDLINILGAVEVPVLVP
jgi:hypothetical protein